MTPISNGARKTIFILSALSFFVIASTAYAQAFVPLAPIPDLTQGATTNPSGLANFLNNLYKYLIGLAAALAVIQITWAGLDIAIWHKDAVSAITNDKEKIYNALFGLVLVLSPVLVFSIINPSILNLSLNLPPLETKSETKPTTATSCPAGQVGTPPNCSTPQILDSSKNPPVGAGWCFLADSNGVKQFTCVSDKVACKSLADASTKVFRGCGLY